MHLFNLFIKNHFLLRENPTNYKIQNANTVGGMTALIFVVIHPHTTRELCFSGLLRGE